YLHFTLFKNHNIMQDKIVYTLHHFPEVTILICAKNEARNLKQNLPLIHEQDYPKDKFKVLVVNDMSDDDTNIILDELSATYKHLHVIETQKNNSLNVLKGKKNALHQGMECITTELVLLTDADCFPSSNKWLRLMLGKAIANDGAVILGYGAYSSSKGLLNKFIRFETLHTYKQYACMAAEQRAYMGVGRNLLYPKKYYYEAINDTHFFNTYNLIPSGDDDLLVSFFSKKNKDIIAYGHQL